MKKLLWKEWIYGRWLAAFSTFILLVINFQMFTSYVGDIKLFSGNNNWSLIDNFSQDGFYKYMNIILIIFIVFIINAIESSNKQYELINVMPYNKKQIIISKWITANIAFIFPLIINFIALISMCYLNNDKIKNYNNYRYTFRWMILSIVTYIFIITFTMFIDSLFGNKIVAAMVNGFIMFIFSIGKELILEFCNIYNININTYNSVWDSLGLPYYNVIREHETYNLLIKISILLVFTVLFFVLMVILLKKAPVENMEDVGLYPMLLSIFKVFFSIIFAVIIGTILSESVFRNRVITNTIFMLVLASISYYGISKITTYIDGRG